MLTFKLKVETTVRVQPAPRDLARVPRRELTEEQETALSAHYYELLVEGLRRVNNDFRQSHDENPEAADPVVRVHAKGTGPFEGHTAIKNRYIG